MKHILASGKKVLISDCDFQVLSKNKWSVNSSGYATNGKIYLHQIIMPKMIGKEVEHKDGNKLNNTRENLRYATRSQNHANRKKTKNTKFQFKGVAKKTDVFRKRPWTATIGFKRKVKLIGYFKTEREAAIAYNLEASKIYGEFVRLNIV